MTPTRRNGTKARKGSERSRKGRFRNPLIASTLNGWRYWPAHRAEEGDVCLLDIIVEEARTPRGGKVDFELVVGELGRLAENGQTCPAKTGAVLRVAHRCDVFWVLRAPSRIKLRKPRNLECRELTVVNDLRALFFGRIGSRHSLGNGGRNTR